MSLLRRYRLAAGLTQIELARRLGVGSSSVSFWESGTTIPSAAMFPKLARILGVDVMVLTQAVDPEKTPSVGTQ
jgi:transcriptional regulator with XRE-family HTH domain